MIALIFSIWFFSSSISPFLQPSCVLIITPTSIRRKQSKQYGTARHSTAHWKSFYKQTLICNSTINWLPFGKESIFDHLKFEWCDGHRIVIVLFRCIFAWIFLLLFVITSHKSLYVRIWTSFLHSISNCQRSTSDSSACFNVIFFCCCRSNEPCEKCPWHLYHTNCCDTSSAHNHRWVKRRKTTTIFYTNSLAFFQFENFTISSFILFFIHSFIIDTGAFIITIVIIMKSNNCWIPEFE